MLSGITSYLFGTNNADDYNQTKTEEPHCRLRTRYGDDTDEWLIVDPSSSRDSSCDHLHGDQVAMSDRGTQCTPVKELRVPLAHCECVGEPRRSLEDSWLVTPPSCFTAGGVSPERMEPGPLENLLIEHPSMSVYGPRGQPSSAGEESESSDTPSTRQQRGIQRRPPRRAHAVAARAGILSQSATYRSMQRASVKQTRRKLASKALERSNKIVCYRSTQPTARQRGHIRQPAFKSGNKRC